MKIEHLTGKDHVIRAVVIYVIAGQTVESLVTRKDGEWVVRVREAGATKWYADADYFTNDKDDALLTRIDMVARFGVKLAQAAAEWM